MVVSTAPAAVASGARMPAAQRRAEILTVARHVLARGGASATTDDVARAAGVSQPYVVRLFGSKAGLVLETHRAAAAEVLEAFEAVPPGPDAARALGEAYIRLLADRDLLVLLMQGFLAAPDSPVAAVARHTLGEAFRIFRDRTGSGDDAARTFVAQGMLINVLVATDALAHRGEHEGFDGLVACAIDPASLADPEAGPATDPDA